MTVHDYHLFTYLKNWMDGSSQAENFFDAGIQKLIP
jgi:hypothetical protein